jgi:hypothetical protein
VAVGVRAGIAADGATAVAAAPDGAGLVTVPQAPTTSAIAMAIVAGSARRARFTVEILRVRSSFDKGFRGAAGRSI